MPHRIAGHVPREPIAVGEYYTIVVGIHPDIYLTWEEARPLVDGFSYNRYKRFINRQSTKRYLLAMTTSRDGLDENWAILRRTLEKMELRYMQLR